MGTDIQEEINKLIEIIRGFNTDPKIVDQRVKALVITKLEEAGLWATKLGASPKI